MERLTEREAMTAFTILAGWLAERRYVDAVTALRIELLCEIDREVSEGIAAGFRPESIAAIGARLLPAAPAPVKARRRRPRFRRK